MSWARRTARRVAATVTVIGAMTLGAGCSGAGSAYCDTLTENSATSATVFTPVIPGMTTSAEVDTRLALLDEVGDDVPEDLRADFDAWQAHLEEARDLLDSDEAGAANEVLSSADAGAREAGERLADHYIGTCMA